MRLADGALTPPRERVTVVVGDHRARVVRLEDMLVFSKNIRSLDLGAGRSLLFIDRRAEH